MSNRIELAAEIAFALRQSCYIDVEENDNSNYKKCAWEIVETLESLGVLKPYEVDSEARPQLQQANVIGSAADVVMDFGSYILGEVWHGRLVHKPESWYHNGERCSIADLCSAWQRCI